MVFSHAFVLVLSVTHGVVLKAFMRELTRVNEFVDIEFDGSVAARINRAKNRSLFSVTQHNQRMCFGGGACCFNGVGHLVSVSRVIYKEHRTSDNSQQCRPDLGRILRAVYTLM